MPQKVVYLSLLLFVCIGCYSEPPAPVTPSVEALTQEANEDSSSDNQISVTLHQISATVLETVVEDHDVSQWAFATVSIEADSAPDNEIFVELSDHLYSNHFSQYSFVSLSFFSPFENPHDLPYCTVEYLSDGHRKRTDIADPAAWNPSEFDTQETDRFFPADGEASSSQYWLDAAVSRCGYRQFEVIIDSNLRGLTTISTSLARKGLRPNDTFVGTEFQRVQMWGGRVTTLVDGTFATFPYQENLPPGEYWLEIRFFPNWTENREIADLLRVSDIIEEDISVIIE